MSNPSAHHRGFTLIELLVVMAIIAILTAIAVPSYRKYVVRSNRVDAQRALVDVAARQERSYYSTNTYAKNLSDLGATAAMAGSNYIVSVASASTSAYVATATAQGTQKTSDASCQTLSISNTGARTSTGSTVNDPACWGTR